MFDVRRCGNQSAARIARESHLHRAVSTYASRAAMRFAVSADAAEGGGNFAGRSVAQRSVRQCGRELGKREDRIK